MTPSYFRDLAAKCRKASQTCFDLFAKEEFHRLANEFDAKADEADFAAKHPEHSGWWRHPQGATSIDR